MKDLGSYNAADAEVGRWLKSKRLTTSLSVGEVAEKIGTFTEKLEAIEDGKIGVPLKTVSELKVIYGFGEDELFDVLFAYSQTEMRPTL